jgi:hypothetical protein
MSADKIGAQHQARKAVLYVRQSSAHQVQHNRESQVLQYAMRDRLVQLGWSEIEIIDKDLGCSAASGTTRAGFERMVAEVCLGKVGAVAAREVSRFARNSHDWQQLVEMCRVVDTLLVDQEAVYAPRGGDPEDGERERSDCRSPRRPEARFGAVVGSAAMLSLWSEAHRAVHRSQGSDPSLCLRSRETRLWRAQLHRIRRASCR